MNKSHRVTLVCLSMVFFSCSHFEKNFYGKTEAKTVIPQRFLYNQHKPLNEWLDTLVHVEVRKIPLNQFLQRDPFAEMECQLVPSLRDVKISLDALFVSRRQILWSIANKNGLTMKVRYGDGGMPSHIEITEKV